MANITSIKNALRSGNIEARTLDITNVDTITITSGNNAVSVRCTINGREGYWLLKCYYRHKPNLDKIYREFYHPQELKINQICGYKFFYMKFVITNYHSISLLPRVAIITTIGSNNCDNKKNPSFM